MAREHTDYNGQVITPFTIMSEFQRNANAVFAFVFDTYQSITDFEADGAETSRLRFRIDPAIGFQQANSALLIQLRDKLLLEMGLSGRGYAFTEFQWMPVQKVLSVSAVKDNNHVIFTKRGADYDAYMTAEGDLFDDLMAAVWVHGKNVDPYLNAMTPAV